MGRLSARDEEGLTSEGGKSSVSDRVVEGLLRKDEVDLAHCPNKSPDYVRKDEADVKTPAKVGSSSLMGSTHRDGPNPSLCWAYGPGSYFKAQSNPDPPLQEGPLAFGSAAA